MTTAAVFEGLGQSPDESPVTATRPVDPDRPCAVYLSGPDDSWCATRSGVWWPSVGLWVDRRELTDDDVAPAGARLYPLLPPPGLDLGAVHGQVVVDVAHVLVTAPGGEVVTQASARFAGERDLALLVLTTLILACGHGQDPTALLERSLADRVVRDLNADDWTDPGWTLDVVDLPGRVVRALSL